MNVRLVIAMALSLLIILASAVLNKVLNPPVAASPPSLPASIAEGEQQESHAIFPSGQETENSLQKESETTQDDLSFPVQDYPAKIIREETDLYSIRFSTVGGTVRQLNLLKQLDNGEPIPMVLDNGSGVGSFNISFGGPENPYIQETFEHKRILGKKRIIHQFSRDFVRDNQLFRLTKSYTVIPGEYIIELIVSLKTFNGQAVPLLNPDEAAYTLTYGPQIGPVFDKIDGRYEVRENVSWGPNVKNGKFRRVVHKDKSGINQTTQTLEWAAIIGKYFGVVMYPGSGNSTITWDSSPADGQEQANRLQVSKPSRRLSIIEDTFRYYIGPLDRRILSRYDAAKDNAFSLGNMNLTQVPKTGSFLRWLQAILRFCLEQFYKFIPNYGVAIILLTVLIKVILYPITRKTYHSTTQMQTVQPRIRELQERHKGDPRTLNAKIAELYKSEKINPLGGCLPLLLQLPVFIALFQVLNQYFPLRGAVFIQGWVEDLSAPEAIIQFERGISIFGASFDSIRLLPVLNFLGQVLSSHVTQKATKVQSVGSQQKFLTYGMPVFLFFLLYNVPSGLLIYWTCMNIITTGQQLFTNYMKNRKGAQK